MTDMPTNDEAAPSIPAAPQPLQALADGIVMRVLEGVRPEFEATKAAIAERLELLEQKSAARHRLIVTRLTKIERKLADHESRITALETTRIVLRGIGASLRKRPRRKLKKAAKGRRRNAALKRR